MNPTDSPNLLDVHIGARIRLRRELLGLSLESVARTLDLTAAEIAAFESGYSRVSAARLYDIARFLDVKVAYFFAPAVSGTARSLAYDGGLNEGIARFDHAVEDVAGALPH